jgi:hypothetical protein
MAGAVATREPVAVDQKAGSAEPPADSAKPGPVRLFEPSGATLEDFVLEAWEDLVVQGRVECPVCGGAMSAVSGCESCGSELS